MNLIDYKFLKKRKLLSFSFESDSDSNEFDTRIAENAPSYHYSIFVETPEGKNFTDSLAIYTFRFTLYHIENNIIYDY